MPVVPKYQGNVQANSIPTDRVPTEAPLSAFGGGEAVSGAYQAAGKLVQDIEQRIDATAIIEADNELTVAKNEILGKVKSFKGKDAPKAQEEAQKLWQEKFEKVNSGLIGRQQAKFAPVAAQGWQSIYSSTEDHVNKEVTAWQDDTEKNGVALNQKEAINGYAEDPGLVQKSLFKQEVIIETRARRLGWSDEQLKLAKLDASTDTHAGVIQNMLSKGEDITAKSYYEQNKNHIDKEAGKAIIEKLEAGSSRVLGVQLSDKLYNTAGMTETKALKELEKETNIDARIIAEQRIRQRFSDKAAGRVESQRVKLASISNILEANNFDLSDPRVVQLRKGLDINGKDSVDAFAGNRGFKHSDGREFEKMEEEIMDTDMPIEDMALRIESGPYNIQERKKLNSLLKERESNSDSFLKKSGEYGSEKEMISIKAKELGIAKKKLGAFQDRVKKEIEVQKKIRGDKGLPREDKQKIVDELAMKQSTGWFSSDYKFNISPAEQVAEIPEADLADIKAALVAARKPVTPEYILNLYKLGNPDGE